VLVKAEGRTENDVIARRVMMVAMAVLLTPAALSADRAQSSAATAQKVYKEWKVDELLPSVVDLGTGHDWNKGREVFRKVGCGLCHAFGSESEGTGLAPDLTGVGASYSRDFILQSIIEPSATINGRFFHTKFTLKNGDVVTGSVIEVVDRKILVAPVMMNPQATVTLAEADVKAEEPSPISPMPAGLLNELTKEQIVELIAFLDAGGDRNAPVYRKN
jgi:putative heme-binding domain-containing protein